MLNLFSEKGQKYEKSIQFLDLKCIVGKMARKKQIRNQEYLELENCFTREQNQAGRWKEIFGNDHPITLELGCGKAEFSLELARRYPDRNYIGIDLKPDRMWNAASKALYLQYKAQGNILRLERLRIYGLPSLIPILKIGRPNTV